MTDTDANQRVRSALNGKRAGVSAAFNEGRFPPLDMWRETYAAHVARGYERARATRIVIAGLARDVAQILPWTIARMEQQGQYFRDYRIVIYENDSSDGTAELLREWSERNDRVTAISERRADPVNEPSRCLSRAARMASYREQIQRLIEREYSHFDLVMLIDTDLLGGWSYDGVAHCVAQHDWDFIGANGIIYRRRGWDPNAIAQYDAWAYRDDAQFTPRSTKEVNRLQFPRGLPMQRVFSCFGGVGIYRMPAYLAGRYSGTDVEHVTFHREMHRQGYTRTYLNPNLIAVYGRRHRSLDAHMARVMSWLDRLPGRAPTKWCYGAETQLTDADVSGPQPSRAA